MGIDAGNGGPGDLRRGGCNRDSWRVLHRQIIAQGGPFATEVAQFRQRAIRLVATLVARGGTSAGVESAERYAEGLAAGLVGAAESVADWWLDQPQLPPESIAAQLMNLTWLGFGDLVAGRAWVPPDDQPPDDQPPDDEQPDT